MARMNQAMTDLLRYSSHLASSERSLFNKNHSYSTTFDSGYVIPVMLDRVVPGDEKKIRFSGLARMTTPVNPVMDQAVLDCWCFYCPDRLLWNHAREFYGENLDASFNPDGEYEFPSLEPLQFYVCEDAGNGLHSLNDYFGMPYTNADVGELANFSERVKDVFKVDATPWRMYQLIWNEWFRNSSIQPALQLNTGDVVTNDEWNVIRQLRLANKFPDMFTTLLREPQAGPDVLLPLGEWAPVVTRGEWGNTNSNVGLNLSLVGGGVLSGTEYLVASPDYTMKVVGETTDPSDSRTVIPRNLWADLTNATAATINNLRAAITVQQLYEKDALAGKRYQNILFTHYSVFTPDATLQRPELLGASRTDVGMRQVLSTATTEGSPIGYTGAVSVTNVDNEWICNKAFTEPGWIMCLATVRPVHTYAGGINPLLTQLTRFEKYWPVFNNLGNQPVMSYELGANLTGSEMAGYNVNNVQTVLGYKEAWQEYRMKSNTCTALMRPDVDGSIGVFWNYSEAFQLDTVELSDGFIQEDPLLIDRTLAVQNQPQFLLDCYFDYTDIKGMTVHSTPGLTSL